MVGRSRLVFGPFSGQPAARSGTGQLPRPHFKQEIWAPATFCATTTLCAVKSAWGKPQRVRLVPERGHFGPQTDPVLRKPQAAWRFWSAQPDFSKNEYSALYFASPSTFVRKKRAFWGQKRDAS